MLIGELARHTGTTTKTLRFYESTGLITEPERTPGGYRDYPSDAAERVRFIHQAQAAGFSLRQIRQVLDPADCRGYCTIIQADTPTASVTEAPGEPAGPRGRGNG